MSAQASGRLRVRAAPVEGREVADSQRRDRRSIWVPGTRFGSGEAGATHELYLDKAEEPKKLKVGDDPDSTDQPDGEAARNGGVSGMF